LETGYLLAATAMQSSQDVHLLFTLLARMDSYFAADDASPADRRDWKKRHIVRMLDVLTLVEATLREERERGRPFGAEMAKKLEGYARFGLKIPPRA
jgi:hypothetical protein